MKNDRIRNELTRHMNQAGGIKPELQLRGENNRSNRKDRSLFVSNTNDTKLILKAKKKLLPFYLIRWLTRASSLRIRRTLVEMALFITNYGVSVCAGEGTMHTSYLSRTRGRRPCKFFLAGVNFYRFYAKKWRFHSAHPKDGPSL